MFGFIKKRKPIILAHWYVPLLDFQSDVTAFYTALEEDFKSRQVPEMTIERMLFRQAGWLSADHEYLRLHRERVVFDICSAKFGTSWWFSARAAVLPRLLRLWEILVTLVALGSFLFSYWQLFGVFTGSIVFGSSLVFLFIVFYAAREAAGLDEFLLYMPVVGALYERFARAETYYRQDKRLMFADIVDTIVRTKTKEFCLSGGVNEPTFKEVSKPQQLMNERELAKYFGADAPVR